MAVIQNLLFCCFLKHAGVCFLPCLGISRIEALQTHQNFEVYKAALAIIDKFFSEEVTLQSSMLPVLGIITKARVSGFSKVRGSREKKEKNNKRKAFFKIGPSIQMLKKM